MSNLKTKVLIGALIAVVLVLGVASVASADSCVISSTLRQGSVGADVVCLQSKLGLTADGKFGPMTKAAVMSHQSANGLVADGVVGAMTRASLSGTAVVAGLPAGCTSTSGYSSTTGVKCDTATSSSLPAGCTSTAGYSVTTGAKCDGGSAAAGPLAGTDGMISDVNLLSQYSGEEVGEGSKDIKVIGLEVVASNDGDISLKSMKVSAAIANASGSRRFEDYVETVKIWQGTTKVGEADAVDFNKDSTGNYSKTITLSDAVVRADKTEKFYVTLDGKSNLDGDDINSEVMTMGVDSIRFEDGSGVVTTDATTGDLPVSGVSVSFVTFSTSADTELKISTNSTPEASVIKADANNNTDNVVLLKGKLKLDGTSDVLLDALPITLTAAGGDGDETISGITGSVTLTLGSNSYTESTGTNCVDEADFSTAQTCSANANLTAGVLFDNLDYTIDAGSTVNFTVSADINDLENTGAAGTDFDAGDNLLASLTTTGRAFIVAENEAGDQLTDGTEMTGSAIGKAQTFRSTGLTVNLVDAKWVSTQVGGAGTGDPDLGTYEITFDATAFGGDMYIDGTKPTIDGTNSIDLDIIPATGGTGTLDAVITSSTGATRTGNINTTARFLVSEGETERFTITTVVTPTVAGGLYAVSLASIAYNTADVDITDALPALEYTTNLTDFVTDSANLKLTN